MSRKKTGQFKVYFEDNGDMMYREPYVNRWAAQQPGYVPPQHKTEDNHVFFDTMEYVRWYGNVVTFKSLTSGRKYHMFLRHFDEVMKAKRMINNVIEGDFTFTKHGSVQAFKMILPKPAP
jgi:hypothetical protein